jgi:hypothetical protein
MAQHPNQALVRRGFQAFNDGDMQTLIELIADDAVQVVPGNSMLSGEHKGREAILAMYARIFEETGGTFRANLEAVYAGDHLAVAVYRSTGERKGKMLDAPSALLFEIIAGQVVKLTDLPEDIAVLDDFLA